MSAMIKAVVLISGGLDSALAARVVMDQGIEVIGISCRHPFHAAPPPGEEAYPVKMARQLGIELVRKDVTDEIFALVADPPHGRGRHLNPCIDCRITYLQRGAALMEERGAGFLVTGEVIGQRPMSQRRDAIAAIDRATGLQGKVLRPLSARLMAETEAESTGLVDRSKLYAISGRSRKEQLKLAEHYGLTGYSAPAGGCLLTMEGFVAKVEDLIEHEGKLKPESVELLKRGRHFRLADKVKLVVGRDEGDNDRLLAGSWTDAAMITTVDVMGPAGVLLGPAGGLELETALSIIARYVSRADGAVEFEVTQGGATAKYKSEAASPERIEEYRI